MVVLRLLQLRMFARTPVAKAFRKWVLDVIEQYGDRVPAAEPVMLNDELISASERAELKLIVDAKLSTYPGQGPRRNLGEVQPPL